MARVELSNGNWIDLKDRADMKARDVWAVQESLTATVGEDGVTQFRGSGSAMTQALLRQVITGWSWPLPIPSQDPSGQGIRVLDDDLSASDLRTLQDALKPLQEEVSPRPNSAAGRPSGASSSS